MNKNSKNKKKYVRPTTAIVTPGKILSFGDISSNNSSTGTGSSSVNSAPYIDIVIDEASEDNAVSYSSRGSAVNNVWDEADSYDGDILMK